MSDTYNFYNLEASFKQSLLAGNKNLQKNTIKNYLSDLRHFVGWFILKQNKTTTFNYVDLISQINLEFVSDYQSYLLDNQIPPRTINRRLSTLRKLCSFALSQGWLKENVAKKIRNLNQKIDEKGISNDLIIQKFKTYLFSKGLEKQDVLNCVNDIKEFFTS